MFLSRPMKVVLSLAGAGTTTGLMLGSGLATIIITGVELSDRHCIEDLRSEASTLRDSQPPP